MNTITLNGQEFNEDEVGNLANIVIVYELDETTRTVGYSTTTPLTFQGDAYDLIFESLRSECSDWQDEIEVEVYIACINRTYEFKIIYEGVDFDQAACTCTTSLLRSDEDTQCMNDLANSIFWRRNKQLDPAFLAYPEGGHPRVHYCLERFGIINRLLAIVRVVIGPILLAVNNIQTVVNFIGNLFGGDDIFPDKALEAFDSYFSGCGHYHYAPLVREIFEFNLEKCGAKLTSSILTKPPYNRMGLFMARYEEGYDDDNLDTVPNAENLANLTILQLADDLTPVFNAQYRLKDKTFYFERKDYFDTFYFDEIDLTEYSVEYEFEKVENFAYGRYEYALDSIDQEGNKAANAYNDIVEWNQPRRDFLRGEKNTNPQFGTSTFLFDRVARKSAENGTYRHEMDFFRADNTPVFGNKGDRVGEFDMIMTNHTASELKLLVFEEGFERRNANTIKREVELYINLPDVFRVFDYNYPLYFDENYEEKELYQRFHYIDDPTKRETVYFIIPELSIPLTSDLAQRVDDNGIDINLQTSIGDGKARSIEVDFGNNAITFNNIRVRCSQ